MTVFPFPITKLYGLQIGYLDNALKSEYDSGRSVTWQRNTRVRRRYAVSCSITREQARAFDEWYTKTLGGNGMCFSAPSLEGTGKNTVYRMESPPSIEGQAYKEITMEWVEV